MMGMNYIKGSFEAKVGSKINTEENQKSWALGAIFLDVKLWYHCGMTLLHPFIERQSYLKISNPESIQVWSK